MDQPIACSLTASEMRRRQDDTAEIARRALTSRVPLESGERLTFDAGPDTERELRAVIAAESECCSFLAFDLTREPEKLRLDVTGPADARPIIEGLFA